MILAFQDNILVLRNAEKNNNYKPNINVKVKTAMNGEKYSFLSTSNSITQSFKINELTTCGASKEDIFNFLKATAGQEIRLIDHNSEVWTGKIINDPHEILAASKNVNSLDLIFEGVQI